MKLTDNYHLIPIINRSVLIIKGPDRHQFLQELITNDMDKLQDQKAIYALLLSPQGRFLYDFIITEHQSCLRLEVETDRCDELQKLLTIYKLRSKVAICHELEQHHIFAWLGPMNTIDADVKHYAYHDPRCPELGIRVIIPDTHIVSNLGNFAEYDLHRLHLGIPDGSRDMQPDKAIPLEYAMDDLQAINWHKGCYLGQELTARTKHRGIVRKGLFPAHFKGTVPKWGTKISVNDHEIGQTLTSCESVVLCRLRIDHDDDLFDGHHQLKYNGGTLIPYKPAWMPTLTQDY